MNIFLVRGIDKMIDFVNYHFFISVSKLSRSVFNIIMQFATLGHKIMKRKKHSNAILTNWS